MGRFEAMSKRTTMTSISALPPGITREVVIDFLHNFSQMIDLNPLVIERHVIPTPAHAPADERDCVWYSITDKIAYLPGGLANGEVTYKCVFKALPNGLQTHCYAPAGLDLREKWTINGTLPGEPPEAVELGIGAPATGLYLREDLDMRCNMLMTSFVKKTLTKSHAKLVDQLRTEAKAATATEQMMKRANTMVSNPQLSPVSRSAGKEAGSMFSASPPPPVYSSPYSSPSSKHAQLSYTYRPIEKGYYATAPSVAPLLPVQPDPPSKLQQVYGVCHNDGRYEKRLPPLPPLPSIPPAAGQQQQYVFHPGPQYEHAEPQAKLPAASPQESPASGRPYSMAATPASATDRSMIPEPLRMRPKSSDDAATAQPCEDHPLYPTMNPYTSDMFKTPTTASPIGMDDSPIIGRLAAGGALSYPLTTAPARRFVAELE